ncbi:MAG: 4Fe-4S binding protein [Gemmatimonadetes bacterium]|nr:4Fe-4S binding protein [Gemmatimonadota bacterium]
MPWIDNTRCTRELDCPAARLCKHDAMTLREESGDEPGTAAGPPRIDLEKCKRCGDCEHACRERAIRMI